MLLPTLLCLALSGAAPQDRSPGANGSWRALPLPGLCRSAPPAVVPPRLVGGSHLITPPWAGNSAAAVAALNPAAFASLLSEESRRSGWNVSVHPIFPPLLVNGPDSGCQSAADFCAEIDRASRGLEVELSVWLVRASGASAAQAVAPKDAPWGFARLISGGETTLGEQAAQSYVHNYSVEVATDSGVAAPVIGRALTGDIVHLRAMRARGGTAVYIDGLLDLSRLVSMDEYALSAPDLGSLHQPRVQAFQVAFSGTVASGTPLRVSWSGMGTSEALTEGSLWIIPRATPDAREGRWRVMDTALLSALPWELPLVPPGVGLDSIAELGAYAEGPAPVAATLIAKEAEVARSSASRSRPLFVAGENVVLGPSSEEESWAAIDGFHGALEASRTRNVEIQVQRGAGSVRLPVAGGAQWRVLICDETTAVLDYDVEIAPETWMPGPRVERSLEGFCAQGLSSTELTTYTAWVAGTSERRTLERAVVPLGRLEVQRRAWRSSRGEVRAGQSAEIASGTTSALTISVRGL